MTKMIFNELIEPKKVLDIIQKDPTAIVYRSKGWWVKNGYTLSYMDSVKAFELMSDEQKYTFPMLPFVDDIFFHGNFNGVLNIENEEFMLFLIKTMIILDDYPYSEDYNLNSKKLHAYLDENLNNFNKIYKKAKLELKMDSNEFSKLVINIIPF